MASVEGLGLAPDALRAAPELEHAERVARRGVAEVDVEGQAADRAEPTAARQLAARGSLSLGPARRALLEGALADARAILALLDREDKRAQRALI